MAGALLVELAGDRRGPLALRVRSDETGGRTSLVVEGREGGRVTEARDAGFADVLGKTEESLRVMGPLASSALELDAAEKVDKLARLTRSLVGLEAAKDPGARGG